MKALVLGITDPWQDRISAAQLYPFVYYRRSLHRHLGLSLRILNTETLTEIHYATQQHPDADIFFIRPTWHEDPDQVQQFAANLRGQHPHQKIILIDPFDQTSSRFFGTLPFVDALVKYQCLKDVTKYRQPFIGGTMLTDYLVKRYGYDLEGWFVGSEVPPGYEQRIVAGWNLGLDSRWIRRLHIAQLTRLLPQPRKTIDIFCRMSLGSLHQQEWYGQYRLAATEALTPLAADYQLAISGRFQDAGLISRQQYDQELKSSRIVFSPFGWGEITWRDFEAACSGALLIKPSVAHVETYPNLYIPGETYVPVTWDFVDVEEKCRYYLTHPTEAQRIAHNARQAYWNYLKQGEFVQAIARLIHSNPAKVECDRPPLSRQTPPPNGLLIP
ncbi:MAG: glycosyltransferase [Oculatellaceae cyanobacterium Prado106]|jgi:hypothetical protein|nr:glycosyltransferase [Oculatellaceae cyanobacterium Prado106]